MAKNSSKFKEVAVAEWKTHPEDIKRWAAQTDNLLLQRVACEVMEAVGVVEK